MKGERLRERERNMYVEYMGDCLRLRDITTIVENQMENQTGTVT